MKLYIELLDGKKIIYQLNDNSVVHKFVKLVRSIRQGRSKVDYESYAMWTSESFPMQKIINEINHSVDYFNENNGYNDRLKPVDQVSSEVLNALHYEFEHAANRYLPNELLTSDFNKAIEKYPVKCKDIELLAYHLNNINSKIHALEFSVGLVPGEKRAYFSIFLRDLLNDTRSIDLESDEFNLFTLDAKFGDLMLGYGTTGKNLYHIYLNNDVNFFKDDNRHSPQTAITTNILGWFSEDKNHEKEISFLSSWLSSNFSERFDLTDPTLSLGYIKLGDLVYTNEIIGMSDEAVIDYYSNNHIVDYYIA